MPPVSSGQVQNGTMPQKLLAQTTHQPDVDCSKFRKPAHIPIRSDDRGALRAGVGPYLWLFHPWSAPVAGESSVFVWWVGCHMRMVVGRTTTLGPGDSQACARTVLRVLVS